MLKVYLILLLASVSISLTHTLDICEYQLNGTRLAHPADCNKFVVCKNGRTQNIRNCPIGLHFNRFKAVCDLRERAACEFEFVQLADKELDCTTCCTVCGCDSNLGTPTPVTPECPDTPTPETPVSPVTPTPETPECPDTPTPETPEIPVTPTPGTPEGPNTPTPEIPDTPTPETPEIPVTPTPGTPEGPNTPTPEIPDTPTPETPEIPVTPTPGTPEGPNTPTPEIPDTPTPETPEIPVTPTPGTPEGPNTPTPENPDTPTPETPEIPVTPTPGTPEGPDTPTPEIPNTPTPETPEIPVTPTAEIPVTPAPNCNNNSSVCVGKPDGSVAHVNDNCNQYIVCVGGCANILSCPNNLLYNLTTKQCDYPQNVNCPWPSKPPTTGPSGVACAQPGKCAGKSDGTMLPDSKSNGYIICQCECEIERPCPVGTKFNEKLQVCGHINSNEGNDNGNEGGNDSGSNGGNGNGNNGGNGNGNDGGNGNEGGNVDGNNGGNGNGNNEGNGNGNDGGNGNGNEGGNDNGNNEGNGNGNNEGNGNGNDGDNGNGNEGGNGNGNNEENGNGNNEGNGNGNNEGNGNGNNGGNAGSSHNICGNNITVCQNQTVGTQIPVEGICNKFYVCNYDCAVEILCPNNLIYNPNKKYCDYPQNYKCPWTYTPPSGPNAGPSGIACASGGRCVGKADGTFFSSNESLNKYVICQCECEVELDCPADLVWDNKVLSCNYPVNTK